MTGRVNTSWVKFVWFSGLAVLGGALGGSALRPAAPVAAQDEVRATVDPPPLTPEETRNVSVYQRANRSVVNITTSAAPKESFLFFEPPSRGAGSGSVLDKKGHILTNYHVVEGADEIVVTLHDGEQYDAGVVGIDPVTDVAVLRIKAPAKSLFPVTFGTSKGLQVGQRVYAIGNPFGWERTMSSGIISSLNRTLPSRRHRTIKSMIQIDAALNQGNSGGPLLNSHAQLIGMNTAIASQSGDSAGIGFAIPVNTLKRIVPQLIVKGRVIRPSIGIAAVAVRNGRLTIAMVTPGGAADRAGLKGYQLVDRTTRRSGFVYSERYWDRSKADQVLTVDGVRVRTLDEFLTEVERKRAGDKVQLRIVRDGREMNVEVKLDASE